MNWLMLSVIMLGGALGAAARYWLGEYLLRLLGSGIPWGTLTANMLGSFLVGLLFAWFDGRAGAAIYWRAFLIVGVLGALTTYSSLMLEAVLYSRADQGLRWLAYLILSLLLGLGLVFLGAKVGTSLRS